MAQNSEELKKMIVERLPLTRTSIDVKCYYHIDLIVKVALLQQLEQMNEKLGVIVDALHVEKEVSFDVKVPKFEKREDGV